MSKIARGKDFRVQLSDDRQQKLIEIQKKESINGYSELLDFLLGLYEKTQVDFSFTTHLDELGFSDEPLEDYNNLSEKQVVEHVVKNIPFEYFVKKAILSEAKRAYWQTTELTKEGKERGRSTSFDIQARIHELVQKRMKQNEEADHWIEQRRITTSWLQCGGEEDEFGRIKKESVFNFRAVKEYFNQHSDEIEAHHKKFNIDEYHNMKVPKELKKRAKGKVV